MHKLVFKVVCTQEKKHIADCWFETYCARFDMYIFDFVFGFFNGFLAIVDLNSSFGRQNPPSYVVFVVLYWLK